MKIAKVTWGICPCCKKKTVFIATDYWLRDYYRCLWCGSIPRQRAVMNVIKDKFPEYRELKMHESSPSGASFRQLRKECKNYSFSYYYDNIRLGKIMENGASNQNLENLTFENNSFDIFITQDVMEHVNNPEKAFAEISRVLRMGGGSYFYDTYISFSKDPRQNKN